MIVADEKEIIGHWIVTDGIVVGDEACERVDALTSRYLEKLGVSPESGGWETLFRDPNDGRYRELTYPHGNWHGGGPAALFNFPEADARQKYPRFFDPK